jgi:hypothetical protein
MVFALQPPGSQPSPQGNVMQASHKYVPNRTVVIGATKRQNSGEAD